MPGPGPASFPWPLWPHSFKSRLGHWQAASVRPARPIAFAGMNSPTLHCCPDARSQAARDRFCHTVAGSSMDPWQLWCGCAGSGPSLPNNRDHSRTTEPPQQTRCKPKRRCRRRVASRSAAASSRTPQPPLPLHDKSKRRSQHAAGRSAADAARQAEALPQSRVEPKRRRLPPQRG